jgi:S-adenosylmethionine/arginine decarboxylase-like enzyme
VTTRPFGYEMLCDCYGCAQETLDDINLCYSFLEEAVHTLGVSKQSQPHVFRSPDAFVDKAGISGWVPLIESAIVIHTIIPKKFVAIDYFTCSIIDTKMKRKLRQLAERFFRPGKVETHLLKRGLKYNEEE